MRTTITKLKRIRTLTAQAIAIAILTAACAEQTRTTDAVTNDYEAATPARDTRSETLTDRQKLGKQLGGKRLRELAITEIVDALINSDHPGDYELGEYIQAEADYLKRREHSIGNSHKLANNAERIVDDIEIAVPRLCDITQIARERALMPESDTC